jgi:alpha-glucosidase
MLYCLLVLTTLASPDGKLNVKLESREEGLVYSATLDGKPVVLESALGFGPWKDARAGKRTQARSAWKPVYGERDEIPDRYNSVTVESESTGLDLRVFDEGFAFRYRLKGSGAFEIAGEKTEIRFPEMAEAFEEHGPEGEYALVRVKDIKPACERPLTVRIAQGLWASVAEAAATDYPRTLFSPGADGALVTETAGAIRGTLPFATPWRVFVVGRRAGDLPERNYLVLNLSEPQKIADTAWIKPGKVIREVTLSTRGGKRAVDFAVERGLQYVEYDAGWYGHEYDDASDATVVAPDPKRIAGIPDHGGLDLPEVIRYAKVRGVGIILYVNRRALERQIDTILPLYRQWGVAGVKYGFVQTGPQQWTRWLHEAIAKAASHNLMVDVHDAWRPSGFTRTYPNLMTVEGVRGNEHMPDARHNTILPFTRAIAGSYDYTICWMTNRLKTTKAHQMAQSVIHYSPWQFLFWYDRPDDVEQEPALDWFKHLPTVWDETRVLDGTPGEYVVTARRKGRRWWLGAISNGSPRTVSIAVPAAGHARIWCDGAGPRSVSVADRTLKKGETITLEMAASGGCAVELKP